MFIHCGMPYGMPHAGKILYSQNYFVSLIVVLIKFIIRCSTLDIDEFETIPDRVGRSIFGYGAQ